MGQLPCFSIRYLCFRRRSTGGWWKAGQAEEGQEVGRGAGGREERWLLLVVEAAEGEEKGEIMGPILMCRAWPTSPRASPLLDYCPKKKAGIHKQEQCWKPHLVPEKNLPLPS